MLRDRSSGAGGVRSWVLQVPSGAPIRNVVVASGSWSRMRGLLGRNALGPDEGLLIPGAARVHTFAMRFPIDAVFCDGEMSVVGVQTLVPNRLSRRFRGARHCLEIAAGRAREAGIVPGVRLCLDAV